MKNFLDYDLRIAAKPFCYLFASHEKGLRMDQSTAVPVLRWSLPYGA